MSPPVRFRTQIPAYRQRPGRSQALVTLTDTITKHRRDYWLGEFGTPESREAYHRIIAEWESRGRRLPILRADESRAAATNPGGPVVSEIIQEYFQWASGYYRPNHVQTLKSVLGLLRKFYGQMPAAEFGPQKLRLLREEMIRGHQKADPPRRPWSRKYINAQVQRIRHMFKWAAARELAPVSVFQSLGTLESMRRGRSAAREGEKVGPVPQHLLDAILPHMSRPVRALVELQLFTGARAGELVTLRPIDIEIDERSGIWAYRPQEHKNAFRDQERIIYFGPRAQEVIRPFLANRPTHAYLFSPIEAEAERRALRHARRVTPLSCGSRPGKNLKPEPAWKPGERFITNTYHRAIEYACDRAFPLPAALAQREDEDKKQWRARLNTTGCWDELRAWRRAHRFHPHQLRHNAATNLRREFGLEAAQLALGHASAQITDAVYAERDRAKVIEIMRKIG